MAFFTRPHSASAAVKIVAPTAVPGDPIKTSTKKDSTQRQCRNILIYGSCKFQDKGCIYSHPPRPTTPPSALTPQPEPPGVSAKLSQAVNAPVFVPKSSPLPPTSPPLSRVQAQPPFTASTLSTSSPASEYDENDSYDHNYYVPGENDGLYDIYSAESVVPQVQALEVNSLNKSYYPQFQPEYDQGLEYYPKQSTFIRQPLDYHLYSLPPPSLPPSHFISPTLRTDLQLRSEIIHTAPAPGLNLPDNLQGYHTLVPLESVTGERRKFGNWYSTVYRATGKDGRAYVLRRVSDFHLMHQAAFQSIEQWSRIRHPNIVAVHEAFTTRSFSDNSLVVAYTYHPNAQTLYDAHIKIRAPTFVQGRLQAAQQYVPERTLWSYIIQIAGAIKAAHDQGLPVRMIDVTKVIVSGRNRLRIGSCGLADVLTYNPASSSRVPGVPLPAEQIQEDLVMFGKLIMAMCCNNVAATNNFGKSLDIVTQHYSADLKNVALFCLSKAGSHKHIGQLFDMIGSRLLTEMDDLQNGMDYLEGELMSELENARLVRLLCKFGFINERPEFARDARWSETGDRYIIKLFRDYVFHQVDEHGRPIVSLSHVLSCLNKLDAGTDERIMLVSRDEQSVLVVSYKDVKACIASAFAELSQR
ncbi:hypothetical protein F5148DRAFT_1199974 [Russula earlei]|uniref:Uncharacterized protein n=1 Tax=Russula earlei TaxID=71964 RepID=A0ACC0U8L5_9AGAM|nr:hypothetical protein F5148DRAFT_1199974 [Russula earlei]